MVFWKTGVSSKPGPNRVIMSARLFPISRPPPRELQREQVLNPIKITDSQVVLQVMGDVMNPGLIQFGAAIPDPEMIPAQKLNRMLTYTVGAF